MNKILIVILTLITSSQVKAQFIKEKSIDASIGFGLSAADDEDVDITGTGFYMQGEYVLTLAKWIDIRPYAGVIFTETDDYDYDNKPTGYQSNTNALLIGGKTRIKAPIPFIAPYIEFGLGLSIGNFETVTPLNNIHKSGLITHIPFSLGLELGKNHNFDIAFVYYYQDSVQQYVGSLALGYTIPLKN